MNNVNELHGVCDGSNHFLSFEANENRQTKLLDSNNAKSFNFIPAFFSQGYKYSLTRTISLANKNDKMHGFFCRAIGWH